MTVASNSKCFIVGTWVLVKRRTCEGLCEISQYASRWPESMMRHRRCPTWGLAVTWLATSASRFTWVAFRIDSISFLQFPSSERRKLWFVCTNRRARLFGVFWNQGNVSSWNLNSMNSICFQCCYTINLFIYSCICLKVN